MKTPRLATLRRVRAVVSFLGATSIAFALACGTEYAKIAKPPTNDRLFAALVFDHHAVALSLTGPASTIQLHALAINALGTPLTDAGQPSFSLSDTGSVTITPDGLLTATAPATGVQVIATLTDGNLTHKDTAYVNVNDVTPPPVLANFSIQPLEGDSAKTAALDLFGLFGLKQILPQESDAGGTPIECASGVFLDGRSNSGLGRSSHRYRHRRASGHREDQSEHHGVRRVDE